MVCLAQWCPSALSDLLGLNIEYAWTLTNHRGYVDAMGILDGRKVESHIQADTFLLALAETYRWWRSATTSEPE
jgi:hypothetical protein